jgi:hypothetical protein
MMDISPGVNSGLLVRAARPPLANMHNPGPFETIDSAQEFMTLLDQVVTETTTKLQTQLHEGDLTRSADGLRLAIYKLQQLREHVHQSRRILNDLDMIERVLMGGEIIP